MKGESLGLCCGQQGPNKEKRAKQQSALPAQSISLPDLFKFTRNQKDQLFIALTLSMGIYRPLVKHAFLYFFFFFGHMAPGENLNAHIMKFIPDPTLHVNLHNKG